MTASCLKVGCDRVWDRDPVLEVQCPTCGAGVGTRCVRPSEHRVWGGEPHASRDVAADQAGHYGHCPLGCCGLDNIQRKKDAAALPLFAATGLIAAANPNARNDAEALRGDHAGARTPL